MKTKIVELIEKNMEASKNWKFIVIRVIAPLNCNTINVKTTNENTTINVLLLIFAIASFFFILSIWVS